MLDVVEGALRYAGRVVAGIRDEQRAAPTPRADHPVEALTAHLVQGVTWFGGLPGMTAEPVPVPAQAPATDRLVGFLGRDPASRHG